MIKKSEYTRDTEKNICKSLAELKPACFIRITDKTCADYNTKILCDLTGYYVNGLRFEANGQTFFLEWDRFKIIRMQTDKCIIRFGREITVKTW